MTPTITMVRWLDACQQEAIDSPEETKPALAELLTVGFLIAETAEVLTVGMEVGAADVHPGRYRFHIPKVSIVERHDATAVQAFKKPRARKPKATPPEEQTV